MGFIVAAYFVEQKTYIVLINSSIACITSLLEMINGSGIFKYGSVYIFRPLLVCAYTSEYECKLAVKSAL